METKPTPHMTAVAYYQCEFNECCVLCPYNDIKREEGCLQALRSDVLSILMTYDQMLLLERQRELDIQESQPEKVKGDLPLERIADFIRKELEPNDNLGQTAE